MKKNILCHYSIKKEYLLNRTTINELINSGKYNFFISVDINNFHEYLFYNKEKNNKNFNFLFNIIFFSSFLRIIINFVIKVCNFFGNNFVFFFYYFLYLFEYFRLYQLKKRAAKIFYQINPDILFLTIDRTPGVEVSLIKLANKHNIKIICLQSFIVNIAGLLQNRKNSYHHINIQSKLSKKILEDQIWLYNKNYYNYFMYPTYLALKNLKILPKNPWVWGANCDYIFTDSSISKKTIEIFLPNKNTFVTGNAITDILISSKNIQNNNILISLPHLSEHKYTSYQNHKNELKKIFAELKKVNSKILLSMHPRSSKKIIEFVKKNLNNKMILINSQPSFGNSSLINEIKNCKSFVSWRSTSIHYSCLAGKPTFIMDWYKLPKYGNEIIEKYFIRINEINDLSLKLNAVENYKNYNIKNKKLSAKKSSLLILKEINKIIESI